MYVPLAEFLHFTKDGEVPDHGWTTLLAGSPRGPVVTSLLWHSPEEIEVRQVLVDNLTIISTADELMSPEEVLVYLYGLGLMINGVNVPGEVFTSADAFEQSAWLQSKGITIPPDHEHWECACLKQDEAKELLNFLLSTARAGQRNSGTPVQMGVLSTGPQQSDWAEVQQVVQSAIQPKVNPRLKTEYLKIDQAAGERSYLNLYQDKPYEERFLKFLSKILPSGQVEGLLIGVDLNSGTESVVASVSVMPSQIDELLKDIASKAFKNGARWQTFEP